MVLVVTTSSIAEVSKWWSQICCIFTR